MEPPGPDKAWFGIDEPGDAGDGEEDIGEKQQRLEEFARRRQARASGAADDFHTLQRYLEAWGAQQEAILRSAMEQIASICASGGSGGRRHRSGTDAPVPWHHDEWMPSKTDSVRQMLEAAITASRPSKEADVAKPGQFGLVEARTMSQSLDEGQAEETPADPKPDDAFVNAGYGVGEATRKSWATLRTFTTCSLPVNRRYSGDKAEVRSTWSQARQRIASGVESNAFEALCGLMIIANAATIAHATDLAVQEAIGGDTSGMGAMQAFETMFIIFYSIELALKLFAFRLNFFFCAGWGWNVLDVFLVVLALYDVVIAAAANSATQTNFSFTRLLRILKVLKTLRTIRLLRMFRELRLIITSMLNSLRGLFWAIIMISLVTYIFGCCFVQSMALHLAALPSAETEQREEIIFYWSSVMRAMNTLYMCSTSGESWRFPAWHLYEYSTPIYCIFLVYIAFFLFVVVNTLTSIVMEAVMSHCSKEQAEIIAEELKRKHTYIQQFRDLYKTLDDDSSGDVTMAELSRHLEDDRMLAFMESLEIDASDVQQFFASLSMNGSHTVDIETFVVGCMKLKGTARSMDLQCLYNSHLSLAHAQRKFEKRVIGDVGQLQTSTNAILHAIASQYT